MTGRELLFTDDELVQGAREALERPPDFGYYGELDLFGSWGLTFAQHRDSDALQRSNYRSVVKACREHVTALGLEPTEYLDEIHCSHWAHGWVDHLAVRVLEDVDQPLTPDNLTQAFRFLVGAAVFLRECYPIWNEEDLSELEAEEAADDESPFELLGVLVVTFDPDERDEAES